MKQFKGTAYSRKVFLKICKRIAGNCLKRWRYHLFTNSYIHSIKILLLYKSNMQHLLLKYSN